MVTAEEVATAKREEEGERETRCGGEETKMVAAEMADGSVGGNALHLCCV